MKSAHIVMAAVMLGLFSGCQQVVDADRNNPTMAFDRYRPVVATDSEGRSVAYVPMEDVTDDADEWYTNRAGSTQFGYSVNHNLAAQIAEPCDLVTPGNLAPPNPIAAIGAVEAYQKGEVKALGEQDVSVGSGD